MFSKVNGSSKQFSRAVQTPINQWWKNQGWIWPAVLQASLAFCIQKHGVIIHQVYTEKHKLRCYKRWNSNITSVCVGFAPITILKTRGPRSFVSSTGGQTLSDTIATFEPLGPLSFVNPPPFCLYAQSMSFSLKPLPFVIISTRPCINTRNFETVLPGAGILPLPLGPRAHTVPVGFPVLPASAVCPSILKIETPSSSCHLDLRVMCPKGPQAPELPYTRMDQSYRHPSKKKRAKYPFSFMHTHVMGIISKRSLIYAIISIMCSKLIRQLYNMSVTPLSQIFSIQKQHGYLFVILFKSDRWNILSLKISALKYTKNIYMKW